MEYPLNLTPLFDQITSGQNVPLHPFQLRLALLLLLQILAPSFVTFFVHLLIQISYSSTSLLSHFLFYYLFTNYHLLNFICSFVYLCYFCISKITFNRIILCIAISTKNLHSFNTYFPSYSCSKQLCHGYFFNTRYTFLNIVRCTIDE